VNEFQGFPVGLVPFLMQLAANNNRDWFKANEKRYETLVRGPSLAFVRAMREPLSAIAPHLVADDRKVGGSLMRIFRDTRFSKDKTPYKTNVGIQFRHDAGKDVHAPGIYLHISPDETFIGFGLWQPEPETLHRLRTAVAEKWDRWSGILAALGLAGFEQLSEGLKRVPRGFPADHPGGAELKRRSFLASAPVEWEDLESPEAPARLSRRLEPSREIMAFLCEALSLPY